jgi:hypothetical protein
MDAEYAFELVREVVIRGRVSKNKNGDHFCWLSIIHQGSRDEIQVAVHPKRKGQTSDSFVITRTGYCHEKFNPTSNADSNT